MLNNLTATLQKVDKKITALGAQREAQLQDKKNHWVYLDQVNSIHNALRAHTLAKIKQIDDLRSRNLEIRHPLLPLLNRLFWILRTDITTKGPR